MPVLELGLGSAMILGNHYPLSPFWEPATTLVGNFLCLDASVDINFVMSWHLGIAMVTIKKQARYSACLYSYAGLLLHYTPTLLRSDRQTTCASFSCPYSIQ